METCPAIFAAALNNEGIAHLEAHRYDQAIPSITKALGIVREELSCSRSRCSCSGCVCSSKKQEGNDPVFHFQKSEQVLPRGVSIPEGEEDGDELFVFKRAMVIPLKAAPPECYDYYVSLSFIILFNLALAYHLRGLATECQRTLRKALRLYEMAYTVHIKEDLTLTALQAMAIVNNMGQIHAELGSSENSQECFQSLLSTFMYVQGAAHEEARNHMDGFVTNVLSFGIQGAKSAPAA